MGKHDRRSFIRNTVHIPQSDIPSSIEKVNSDQASEVVLVEYSYGRAYNAALYMVPQELMHFQILANGNCLDLLDLDKDL